jgi:two-component system cell cycle response regulator DivK
MGTLLVVDDTQDGFDLIADALHGAHPLVHARTGAEALELAALCQPALVLLDMDLPGLSGWEVAAALKRDPRRTQTPVVALTAHAMRGDRERCLAAGCDEYLPKPFRVHELLELVGRWLAPAAPATCAAATGEDNAC